MILLLGAGGYVGQAFARELRRRRWSFIPLTRKAIDYSSFDVLFDYVRKIRPEFIINAAGYAPNPNVDACELAREAVLCANALLPQTIARVCLMTNTPWGHVSSGSIYTGAKVADRGRMRLVKNLNDPEVRRLLAEKPERIHGFTEWDEPNFSFRHAPCNFYSGTKALAEEAIRGVGQSYVWRPRLLFNELDENRNHLWKLLNADKVYDSVNSLTHLEELVRACLDLWERQAPFGIYNVVNPGWVTTRQIIEMMQRILKPERDFEYWKSEAEFHRRGAKAPRSNCILDVSKLLALGIKMRPVEEALEDALLRWQAVVPKMEFAAHGAR
ncbi:MAG: sugar nucleotide-binding protein [Verrucomicrobiota bacterium]|jgi:dTDP-4-dehydrorhamnose reductase